MATGRPGCIVSDGCLAADSTSATIYSYQPQKDKDNLNRRLTRHPSSEPTSKCLFAATSARDRIPDKRKDKRSTCRNTDHMFTIYCSTHKMLWLKTTRLCLYVFCSSHLIPYLHVNLFEGDGGPHILAILILRAHTVQ